MKALVYHNQQDIRLEEIPAPEIGEDEILIEMKACGICGSDLMDWYLKNRTPLVLGHEPAGIIAKTGAKVKEFAVGDKVFVHHHVACLTCHYCIRGDYTLCQQFHGTRIDPGGLAEYFRVPAPNLKIDTLRIPESLSFEKATLVEPVGCCLRALRKSRIQTSDTIAIIGAGTTGIIHTALSKIFGAAKTIVSDFVDYRLQKARKFGADTIVNPRNEDLKTVVQAETDEIGADLVIVTAPSIEAFKDGLNVCRRGGKLCLFAPATPGEFLRLSPKELFFSEIQIIPSYSSSHLETRMALELLRFGRIEAEDLITHRFRFTQGAEAFKKALENHESLKVIVFN